MQFGNEYAVSNLLLGEPICQIFKGLADVSICSVAIVGSFSNVKVSSPNCALRWFIIRSKQTATSMAFILNRVWGFGFIRLWYWLC